MASGTMGSMSESRVLLAGRSSAAVRLGVAGRILVANTVMLVGIVLFTTSVLYIQLSKDNTETRKELLTSSANSIAGSPTVHQDLVTHPGQDPPPEDPAEGTDPGDASAGTDAPGWFAGTDEHEEVWTVLSHTQEQYGYDYVAIVPRSYLTEPLLGKTSDSDLSDGLGAGPIEVDLVGADPEVLLAPVDRGAVLEGRTVSHYADLEDTGLLYVVAPLTDADPTDTRISDPGSDEVIGAVVVGSRSATVRSAFRDAAGWIIGIGALTLLLGVAATWMTSRGLKRVTGDYGTHELGRTLEYYQSVLQAVSEGLVLIDRDRGVVLYNTEAARLLDLPQESSDRAVATRDLDLPGSLRELMDSGRYARDEIHYTDNHVLVVNQQPTPGRRDTWVTTMRDHTELQELSGELVSVKSFSESMRSQTHEYANRLHMIVSLIETGETERALAFATEEIEHMAKPSDSLLGGFDHPVLAALILTKIAQAKERGISFCFDADDLTEQLAADDRDLMTVVGNLVDNAFDVVSRTDVAADRKLVALRLAGSVRTGFSIEVSDDGPGIAEADVDRVFERGWSTKHEGVDADTGFGRIEDTSRGVGLSLVVQAVRRMGGAIDVHEHGDPESGELRGAGFSVWLPGHGASEGRTNGNGARSGDTDPASDPGTEPGTAWPGGVPGTGGWPD